jgi:quercetin dioxygenase-like cupin family protein
MRNTPVSISRVAVVLAAAACLAAGWAAGQAARLAGRSEVAAEGFGAVAVRNVYSPGATAPMHEHARPRLVVVLSGGTLRVTAPDGSQRAVELGTGAVALRGPERHALENTGATTIELVEMELPASREERER